MQMHIVIHTKTLNATSVPFSCFFVFLSVFYDHDVNVSYNYTNELIVSLDTMHFTKV